MADIYKNSREAGAEVRGVGQGNNYEPGAIYKGLTGRDYEAGDVYKYGVPSGRTAIAAPTAGVAPGGMSQYDALNASIAASQEEQPAPPPQQEVGFTDSVDKGLKGLMVTWDFVNSIARQTPEAEEALQKSLAEYKAKASDPRIGEMIKRGNEADGWFEAGKSMLSYAIDNPGLIVNFIGEQLPAVVATLPLGGVVGGVVGKVATRTALSAATQSAVTAGATGAAINSSAVVLQSLGTNYVEGMDKFNGDKERAKDYATTKTLNEVPANAVAGAFLGVNPFTRLAAKSPLGAEVGNIATQTAVQGAGGGAGAYQAAQSVGEEAGKGEILAEILGEGVLAPVDLAAAARQTRGLKGPQSSVTVEAAPKEFDNAAPISQPPAAPTSPVQDTSRLSPEEFTSAVDSPAFMAAMYSRGDEEMRARLQRLNPNLDLQTLVQDGNLVMDGMKIADSGSGPEFVTMFNRAVAESQPAPVKAAAPFDGGTQVGTAPQNFVPVKEKMRLAQDLANEGQMYAAGEILTKEQAAAKKETKVEPTVVDTKVEPGTPVTSEANTPVAQQPGPLTRLAQVEQQINEAPRFGLPSTISAADNTYVVEVGPTGKKRKDSSPVNAFVSHKGKVIKVDADAIIKQYGSEPWTAPKVEGVTALPKDTFNAPEQWLDFVFKHEAAHIANPKKPGEATGAYENRINEIALVQVKGQDFANSVYQPAVQPESTPAPEIKPAEPVAKEATTVAQEETPVAQEKPKRKKRVQFKEVASETPAPQVQETPPVVEEPKVETREQSKPEPKTEPVQENSPQAEPLPKTVVPQVEVKQVTEKPEDFVGPNKDRLYQEADEKLTLTDKILEKYPFKMRELMIDRIKKMDIDGVRKLWGKVSKQKSFEKPRFEQAPNQFDDDIGGVMSNMARSGAMGLDAISELGNKERAEAARRAQLEEEVRQSTKAMNSRAKEAAKGITDPELKALADTQQQEIGGTTTDGFINPVGTVGLKPEFTSVEEVTQAEIDAADAQVDAQALAQNIVEAVSKGEMTVNQAKDQARKEGIGSYNLINAMRQVGMDPSPAEINQSGAIAANYTLNSYIRDSGYNSTQAREDWLRSYDNLRNKDAVELTKTEQEAYDTWKTNRIQYKERLNTSVVSDENIGASLDEVFPNVLFTQFSLAEMRDPNSIAEPMRSVVKDLFQDPARAWLEDIKHVLTIRPDFEAEVMNALTKEEQDAYSSWVTSQIAQELRNADMISRSPAYSQLHQLRFLSPDMFADYKQRIQMADQRALSQILHEAAEMNDRARAAIEAGASPENTIDAQMREYMLRDESMSKNLDEFEDDTGDGTALYKRGYYSGVVNALTVQEHLTNKFAKWDEQPAYTVVQHPNQLPVDVRSRLTSRLENGSFKGALDPKTGHIYLFSDFMEGVVDAEFTMFHELYGHWGMRAFLGSKMDTFLENQYKLNKEVRETADRLRKEAAEMGMPMARLESVEESISDIAAKGDPSLFKQIIGALSAWLRGNGFDTVAKWMDKSGESELAYVLGGARRAARSQGISPMDGAPSDVRYAANKIPFELYATRDRKTTGYARVNPITGHWTVFTVTDIKADDFSAQTVEDYAQALHVLKSVGDVVRAKNRPTRVDVDPKDFVNIPDPREIVGWRRLVRGLRTKLQGQYQPVFEVAEFLKGQGKDNNVVEALKLMEGKTKYYVDAFELNYKVPIERLMQKAGELGATIDDIDTYLIARHAKERNKVIQDINPTNPNGSGMGAKPRTLKNGDVIPGYIDVLRDTANAPYAKELEAIGKLTDKMSRDNANYMLAHNQIDQRTYDSISKYDHYVTLSGNETDLEVVDTSALGGRALNLRGSDAKRALGRGTLPVDVLQNTMNKFLSTIIRGQKAVVANSVLDMVENNPDPNFAVVEEISTSKRLNTERLIQDKNILKAIGDKPTEASGKQFLESIAYKVENGDLDGDEAVTQIRERIREAEARRDISPEDADLAIRRVTEESALSGRLSPNGYVTMVEDQTTVNAPNVFVAKVDGKPVKVVFKDKGAEFINSLSGMSKGTESSTLQVIGAWSRFFSQLVTSWNPAWIPINGVRDFETILSNMTADPKVGAGLANEMRKQWAPSFATTFRYQVGYQAAKNDGWWGKYLAKLDESSPISAEEAKMYDEFRKSGAETFFLDRENFEQTIKSMNRNLSGDKGPLNWTRQRIEGVGNLVDLVSLPMETAPRFAVYKTLRKNGWSVEDAAIYAKEVSVNFNMKGSSAWIRNLFVFANPSIQGTFRLFKDYSRSESGVGKYLPSNRFATVMAGWMMLGIVGNFIARGLGGEDDDLPGMDKLDQIPHHKRSTSLILAPGVPGMAIPIGYGINFFYTMGHYMADVYTGKMSAEDAAIRVAKTGFDAFSPVGSGADSKTVAGAVAKTVTPSIGVPIIELGMNENRFGAPIYKSNKFSDIQEANSYMNFDSANVLSTSAFRGLNEATGGTRYKSGAIDINPAVFDYLLSSYLPGVTTEAYRGADLALRKAKGLDTKEAPLPLVDRLTAKIPEQWDAGAMRNAKSVVDTMFKELQAPDTTEARRKEILKDHPSLGNAKAVLQSTDQQIKTMRRNLEAIERDPKNSDAKKVEARNYYKDLEKKVTHRAVEATLKAGFKKELIGD